MALKLKVVTLPDLTTIVSGGASVGSGFVNEVKFSDFEKVEAAAVALNTKDLVDTGTSYKPAAFISGNVVAVQVQKNINLKNSGIATSSIWGACISADYAAISGTEIAVTAEVF